MTAVDARMPVETPLSEVEFVAFDTETTGCTSATGRMVEVGAVRFRLDGTELDRYQQLINPLRSIPSSVIAVHGITDAMVQHCPDEREVLPEFLRFLGDPSRTLLMAHNASFDMGFVGAAIQRCQLAFPTHLVIDSVRLSRRRSAGLPSHSLSSLVRSFGIGPSTEHRALSDSIALKEVFLNLVSRPPELMTLADLFAVVPGRQMSASSLTAGSPGRRSWSSRRYGGQRFPRRMFRAEPFPLIEGDGSAETPHFQEERMLLLKAISTARSVSLVYEGGRSAGERRRLTPIRLVASSEVTYLLAFCHVDRKQKQYRLDRIRDLAVE